MNYEEFRQSRITDLLPTISIWLDTYAEAFKRAIQSGWTKENLLSPSPLGLISDKNRVAALCKMPEQDTSLALLGRCQLRLTNTLNSLKSEMSSCDFDELRKKIYDVLAKQPDKAASVFMEEMSVYQARFKNGQRTPGRAQEIANVIGVDKAGNFVLRDGVAAQGALSAKTSAHPSGFTNPSAQIKISDAANTVGWGRSEAAVKKMRNYMDSNPGFACPVPNRKGYYWFNRDFSQVSQFPPDTKK